MHTTGTGEAIHPAQKFIITGHEYLHGTLTVYKQTCESIVNLLMWFLLDCHFLCLTDMLPVHI